MRLVALGCGCVAALYSCGGGGDGAGRNEDAGGADGAVLDAPVKDAPVKDAAMNDAVVNDAAANPPAPGTVIEDGTCDAGTLAGATCKHLTLQCPGVANLGGSLRSARPAGTTRATILLSSGGARTPHLDVAPAALQLTNALLPDR